VAGRLVWSEARPPGDDAAVGVVAAPEANAGADGATAVDADTGADGAKATPDGARVPAVPVGGLTALAPVVPPAAWTPPRGGPAQAGPPGPPGPAGQAIVTRRADRRRSLKKAERRDRLSTVTGRAVVVALLTVAVVVLLLIAQHGGF
jgi:hypothetical protein